MRLKDKVAIITGAGGAQGKVACILFAKEGAKVVGVSKTPHKLEDTVRRVKALGGDITPSLTDIRKEEEIEAAVAVARTFKGLTPEETKQLQFGVSLDEFCRECGLCLPCPEGLNIEGILSLDKRVAVYGLREWARSQYQSLPIKVDRCTGCRGCETRCPHHLPVMAMLRRTEASLQVVNDHT